MSERVLLTESEKDLLGQVARFAEKRAVNGVYINQMVSASLAAPIILVVALGEQALALQTILMNAVVPDEAALIQRVNENGSEF